MNEYLCMLIAPDDLAAQARGEFLHLAFLAVVGGVGVVSSVLGWLLRRDIKRGDADKAALASEIERVDGKVDALDRRHGYEISDTRIAVAPLFNAHGIDQPNYPSR